MADFKKILFPTDFSPNAEHALQRALRLLDVTEGEVIVQHVVRSYFEKHSHWATLFDVHEMQKYMDMYVEQEMARSVPSEVQGDITFRNLLSEGRAGEQIALAAESEKADLVIMGPAKGAVTNNVVRRTTRPVLSIPAAREGGEPLKKVSRILVATDCSKSSRPVIDCAIGLKQRLGCSLTLLHVIELTNTLRFAIQQGHFMDASAKLKDWAENQLKNLTPHQFLNDPSVERLVVTEGYASDRISDIAEQKDADLVVLGAHGYGPVQRHMVGTTADKVLSGLSRPVLTVQV
jgi:nucleotide-binding universal stress UspA family protein